MRAAMKHETAVVILAAILAGCVQPAESRASRPIAPYAPPLVGARCFDPYLALGTSNIPADSSARTTVINMSAFVRRDSSGNAVPIAMVVKNYAHELWLIPYQGFNEYLAQTIPSVQSTGMIRMKPRLITQPELTRITSALARSEVQVWRCFERDLKYKPTHA